MKITKYGHACVVIEDQGKKLVIDPGSWTEDFGGTENVVAVIITHVHADHFNAAHLAAIAQVNPYVQVYGTEEVSRELAASQVTAVTGGATATVASFNLQFFGGQHAEIHPSMPRNQNVGVLVNGTFYYPGDSFTVPEGIQVQTLALPVSAPWLKVSEMMDFFNEIKPRVCFPTHNAILSDTGQGLLDHYGNSLCAASGATYYSLKPGESIEA